MKADREQYWNPYLGGVLLGLVLFASFFLAGSGLGGSGGVGGMKRFGPSVGPP